MPGDRIKVLRSTEVVHGKPDAEIRLSKGEVYTVRKVDIGVNGSVLYELKEKPGYAYYDMCFEPPTYFGEDLFNV